MHAWVCVCVCTSQCAVRADGATLWIDWLNEIVCEFGHIEDIHMIMLLCLNQCLGGHDCDWLHTLVLMTEVKAVGGRRYN